MDRLCSECYEKIDDEQNVRLMKIDFSGDLCKECWDIEWKKCIKGGNILAIGTENISIYIYLEALIRHFEKLNVDVKVINILKECKNLEFLK